MANFQQLSHMAGASGRSEPNFNIREAINFLHRNHRFSRLYFSEGLEPSVIGKNKCFGDKIIFVPETIGSVIFLSAFVWLHTHLYRKASVLKLNSHLSIS
jgi:hypothetical protein